jgi:hypothetical protein
MCCPLFCCILAVEVIMIKCANCEKDAVYTVDDKATNPVDYCHECLPKWLHDRAAAGEFKLVKPEEVVEAKPKTTKKKTEEPVEEAPADEDN